MTKRAFEFTSNDRTSYHSAVPPIRNAPPIFRNPPFFARIAAPKRYALYAGAH